MNRCHDVITIPPILGSLHVQAMHTQTPPNIEIPVKMQHRTVRPYVPSRLPKIDKNTEQKFYK